MATHDGTNDQPDIRCNGPTENNPDACLRIEHILDTAAHDRAGNR